jgi:hypothetical protein
VKRLVVRLRSRFALATLTMTSMVLCLAAVPSQPIRVNGEILAYQNGYVFFTTGDGFRVSPAVAVRSITGGATSLEPGPLVWARATFDDSGNVVELDLSPTPLTPIGDFSLVQRFALALSSPVPNPDLMQPQSSVPGIHQRFSGKPVIVRFSVQVPPTTPLSAQVYMSTDVSGWNPQAIPMQRVDALHFQVIERLRSGTIMHFLYTRGSFASEERSEGGLEMEPRTAIIPDVNGAVIPSIVYAWADQLSTGQLLQQPNVFPTPYNPAPFPNLPPGIRTPAPRAPKV